MIPKSTQNLIRNDFRALNSTQENRVLWKLVLLLLFVSIFGFFIFSDVSALAIKDNFDSYESGYSINSQSSIWSESGDNWIITETGCYSGKCAFSNAWEYLTGTAEESISKDTIKFYLNLSGGEGSGNKVIVLEGLPYYANVIMFRFYWESEATFSTAYYESDILAENLDFNTWFSVIIEYEFIEPESCKFRFNIADQGFTGWYVDSYSSMPTSIDRIKMENAHGGHMSIDNFSSKSQTYGSCDSGYYLQFCETQEDCEAYGGFWRADFCWEIEPPEIIDWENYYSEHSTFETPTSFITSLVGLIKTPLEIAGGWLVSLESVFDKAKATEKGEEIGEAIPIARGYLATINQFFGGLPISEVFIFFLTITLAVGVFRIIRNIIALIKPL